MKRHMNVGEKSEGLRNGLEMQATKTYSNMKLNAYIFPSKQNTSLIMCCRMYACVCKANKLRIQTDDMAV